MKNVLHTLLCILILLGLAGLAAPNAVAHGGQFRGPGDQVPPGLRDPEDPTPDPPPPVTGGPPPITQPPSAPTGPGQPTGPVTPPPRTGGPSTPGGRPTGGGPVSYEDWEFWYEHNKELLEDLKWWIYHRRSSDSPIFNGGTDRDGVLRGGGTLLTEKCVREVVVPALLWALSPEHAGGTDTESAAYLALAKVTDDPRHIPLLMAGLDRKVASDIYVQDAAALSLGLLRRARPEDQFSAYELDKVRAFLFDAFADEGLPPRTRGFAVVALGLLGDQPTGSNLTDADPATAARLTTARLFGLLGGSYAHEDLLVGVLMAIGLQPAASVLPEQREMLKRCALQGRLPSGRASHLVRAHAAQSLGRIGLDTDVRTMESLLVSRRGVRDVVRRSAAIGLGVMGRLVSDDARVQAAKVLLKRMDDTRDVSTKNFGLISLAYLLRQDLRTRSTAVLEKTAAEDTLLAEARKGGALHKGFAALALGLVVREISDDVESEAWVDFRKEALDLLRENLASRRLDRKTQGAFCVAAGIARDVGSREALRRLVADGKRDKTLRSHAALALGLIGNPTPEVTKTIADALLERSSEVLRRRTAVALGLLGNPPIPGTGRDAVDLLLAELDAARTVSQKGEIVLALARIADHRGLDHLVTILRDEKESQTARAMACVGLGLIGDLERWPSLSRGSRDVNYRASCDLLREYLSIF